MGKIMKTVAALAVTYTAGVTFCDKEIERLLNGPDEQVEIRKHVDYITDTEPGDNFRIATLVDIATQKTLPPYEYTIKAIGRIGTPEAAQALYKLSASGQKPEFSGEALRHLMNLNPGLAREAALAARERFSGYGEFHMIGIRDVLCDLGDESAIESLLKRDMLGEITDFATRNKGKLFLGNYRERIIPLFEEQLVDIAYGRGEYFMCSVDPISAYRYAMAMRAVDPLYAEKRLVYVASGTGCEARVRNYFTDR